MTGEGIYAEDGGVRLGGGSYAMSRMSEEEKLHAELRAAQFKKAELEKKQAARRDLGEPATPSVNTRVMGQPPPPTAGHRQIGQPPPPGSNVREIGKPQAQDPKVRQIGQAPPPGAKFRQMGEPSPSRNAEIGEIQKQIEDIEKRITQNETVNDNVPPRPPMPEIERNYEGPFQILEDPRPETPPANPRVQVTAGIVIAGTGASYYWPGDGNQDYVSLPSTGTGSKLIVMRISVDLRYGYFTADDRPELLSITGSDAAGLIAGNAINEQAICISLGEAFYADGRLTRCVQHHAGNIYVPVRCEEWDDGTRDNYICSWDSAVMEMFKLVLTSSDGYLTNVVMSRRIIGTDSSAKPAAPTEDNGGV
jgi:hypothetical protein